MRPCYKTALRAKGIKPIPPYHRMRSHRDTGHVITSVGLFANCRRDSLCRCRKCKPPLRSN